MQINDTLNKLNENIILKDEKINKKKNHIKMIKINKLFLYLFVGILNIILILNLYIIIKSKLNLSKLNNIVRYLEKKNSSEKIKIKSSYNYYYNIIKKESVSPKLKELSLKRTYQKRLPLPKKINCKPHLTDEELIAFLSLLTKDTIFFETGSGCSSVIAKFYAKKVYSIEGCQKFYELGIKNGLKDNIIFKNLKPDNYKWSRPGKKSNLEDWKNYFQSYKKEYKADVILIDGRFKVATAMDIFSKINDNTIILIHEYNKRPLYFVLENYYKYIYHWGTLFAFVKKKDIKEIPINVQKKYWDKPL